MDRHIRFWCSCATASNERHADVFNSEDRRDKYQVVSVASETTLILLLLRFVYHQKVLVDYASIIDSLLALIILVQCFINKILYSEY